MHAFHVELAGKPQLGSPTAPESAGEHYATLGLRVDFFFIKKMFRSVPTAKAEDGADLEVDLKARRVETFPMP